MMSAVGSMLRRNVLQRKIVLDHQNSSRCAGREDSPVALGGINHGQPVLAFDTKLVLSRLQVPLECVHTSDIKPHVLLQTYMNQQKTVDVIFNDGINQW